ncbi:MAG TPA: hypothetical protein VGP47_08540 [Parachlamydiaceae bacterium]|nr:hypothetical protein [Parachlamydiaceae bacterium]
MSESHDHPFYGYVIIRRKEEEYIKSLMQKYQHETVNEELKKKVWDELQMEKHLGKITIPFKLAIRMDPYGKFPDQLEVILDTKV